MSAFVDEAKQSGVHPVGVGGAGPVEQLALLANTVAPRAQAPVPDVARTVIPARIRRPGLRFMARPRLTWQRPGSPKRLALVVAPPGSGKTALLEQWVREAGAATAWYRASGEDRDPGVLLGYLHAALQEVTGDLGTPWTGAPAAAASLGERHRPPTLLVVDDLHCLEGTAAERTLAELFDLAPAWLTFVLASRRPPSFDLSRRRLAEQVLDIGSDDLRFRCWEAEQLFKEHYGEHLPPEDVATLARRTEGWAAGLQLFHLATRGGSPSRRRRILEGLGRRTALAGEYLTHNVLDELPDALADFLVSTAVLGHLTGPLCDELLGRRGSARCLRELRRRQLFTLPIDDAGAYRYHEVLRSYLELVLVERVGEEEARRQYGRAAALLERFRYTADATRAYSRAGDWRNVQRLVGDAGVSLMDHKTTWIEVLPTQLVDHDPWLLLVQARRALGAGFLKQATDLYRRAEAEFGRSVPTGVALCRGERLALVGWIDATAPASPEWHGRILSSLRCDPGSHAQGPHRDRPTDEFARGVSSLLTGDAGAASVVLRGVADAPDVPPSLSLAARLVGALAGAAGGDPLEATTVEHLIDEADHLEIGWLVTFGRALLALTDRPDGINEAAAAGLASTNRGDAWGAAVAGLLQAIASVARGVGDPVAILTRTCEELVPRRVATLEAWCRWALAAALEGDPHRGPPARRYAERVAARAGVPGAERAMATLLATARQSWSHAPPASCARAAPVTLRCFGGFAMEADGQTIDLSGVKPRHLSALRILASQGEAPVHRETLAAWLWPDADLRAAARNVHVTISTLRGVLPASAKILREGPTYRLTLGEGGSSDVVEFSRAVEAGRAARARDGVEAAVKALEAACGAYGGELLPEEGPAEWVIDARRRHARAAADAARELAQLRLHQGQGAGAIDSCELSLRCDPFDDRTWRVLAAAHEQAGDRVALAQVRRRYGQKMAELGIEEVG